MDQMTDKRRFFIGGTWVLPEQACDHTVENPAGGSPLAVISLGGPADVDHAVAVAQAAFPGWAATAPQDRRDIVETFVRIYRRRYEEMAQTIRAELGAPITMAREQQADTGVGHAEGFLDAFKRFPWEARLPNGDLQLREPIGVVGLITPWNWPMNQVALKVIPALLTGCTCVLKPSEMTPLSAMLFAEMLEEAGAPPGVFNLVNGKGPVVGAHLSRHPDVAMISFTGSTRAGVAVSRDAADTVKRVTLELGGKNPNIVFADCDLETRLAESVAEAFNNSGQSCDAPSRMLIERSVYERAAERIAALAHAQAVGDPQDAGPHIGPPVSQTQWQRVQDLIATGVAEGARLIAGGEGRPEGFPQGHFAKPTVFADVSPDMTLWREEVFGPVLTLTPFDTEGEAVALANDTIYGLAAYVQSGDPKRIRRLAHGLRAGMIHVNGAPHRYGSPFGGLGQSGNGREGGMPGLEEYTEIKILHLPEE